MAMVETRSLVEKAVRGDESAFDELYRQHRGMVYNLALRSALDPGEAEDICQEVWLRVYREARRIRAPEAFPAWLRSVAVRACVDAARRRKRGPLAVEGIEGVEAASEGGPEADVSRREEAMLVWQALAALLPRQSAALFLREVEGYDYRGIAEALQTSVGGVATLLFRARKALARAYSALEGSRQERCRRAQSVMAVLLDGEGSQLERRSLQAHVEICSACRRELAALRHASGAYAALPLLFFAGAPLFAAAQAPVASAASSLLAKLLGWLARAKALTAPAVAGSAIVAGSLAVPLLTERPPASGLPERPAAVRLVEADSLQEPAVAPVPQPELLEEAHSPAADSGVPPSGQGAASAAAPPAPPALGTEAVARPWAPAASGGVSAAETAAAPAELAAAQFPFPAVNVNAAVALPDRGVARIDAGLDVTVASASLTVEVSATTPSATLTARPPAPEIAKAVPTALDSLDEAANSTILNPVATAQDQPDARQAVQPVGDDGTATLPAAGLTQKLAEALVGGR